MMRTPRTIISVPNAHRTCGFTLTELAVVLFIVALLIGGLMMPLAAQDTLRKTQETAKTLQEAHDALLGFAATQGRLPCPATTASKGVENFVAGGSATDGQCSNFYDGFLPAATLGLTPINADGLLLDGWNRPIRYAAWSGTIGTVTNPYTRTDGIRNADMVEVAKNPALSICSTATGITATTCATGSDLTTTAPIVVFSEGKNAPDGATGLDEAANMNGDSVFIFHEPAKKEATNGEFDDMVVWLSPNILYNRMIAAGRLP